MSELPDRPDLDQLRRQARELLRAATAGEPHAVTRLRAVSERTTLSAAQLAVAREHGYPSWPALRAEAERRRRLSKPAASQPFQDGDVRRPLDAQEERWSFGGATAIETAAGVLFPEALLAGPGQATLHARLLPSGNGQRAAAGPHRAPEPKVPLIAALLTRRNRARAVRASMMAQDQVPRFDDVAVLDDQGARYTLRVASTWGIRGPSGKPAGPMSLRIGLDPVPRRGAGWLELRSEDGAATRLLPSARPGVRAGQLTPVSLSPAERELLDHAHSLIAVRLGDDAETLQDILGRRCQAALARTAQIQQSGELDPASQLPNQLTQLCASLTEHRQADGLPRSWSGMLDAAQRADGPRHHLDIGAAPPPIDGVAVQVDSLISMPGSWRLYLRAVPGWFSYSEDRRRKWSPVPVYAEDDLGGEYLSSFGGSTGHRDHEELALEFLPRLNPLARGLKLTFRGAAEEVSIGMGLG